MSFTTPRKRKVSYSLAAESIDADADAESDTLSDLQGDAIDWQEDDVPIGPTPQKNGRVLGLFDALSPERLDTSSRVTRAGLDPPGHAVIDRPVSKNFQKVAKSPLKTPSFLRRQMLQVNEDGNASTPRLLFPILPKRGLSMLINELRDMEDNDEDEGMNVLRELEADFPRVDPQILDGEAVQAEVEDSQAPEKVKWQKKGLKRSHRRVVMRPAIKSKSKKDTEASTILPDGSLASDSDEYINSEDEAADDAAALGVPKMTEVTPDESATDSKKTQSSNQKQAKAKKPGGISQNYKSLKLRNSGAKGGSRFGRGRFGGRR